MEYYNIYNPQSQGEAMSLGRDTQQMPFYMAYQIPDALSGERENDLDMDRLRGLYPEAASEIMKHVEDECDQMEYDGSLMFDEHPDQLQLSMISSRIYDKVKHLNAEEPTMVQDEMLALNFYDRRWGPQRNWIRDLTQVLLLNEIFRRRCRRRNCNRWYGPRFW